VLGKTGFTLSAFPRIALINCNLWEFPHIASEDMLHTGDRNVTEKLSSVVTRYQITGLPGKAYMKSATAAVAANGFRETGFFSCNRHIFHERDPGRI
jgi:hypothetical protein